MEERKVSEFQCYKCKEVKPVTAFPKCNKTERRHKTRCKACAAAYARLSYLIDPEGAKERTSKWAQENREYVRQLKRESNRRSANKQREAHPLKWSARKAVNNAITAGKFRRLPCAICGDAKSEAHHESYEKEHWFDVVFLCTRHHKDLHMGKFSLLHHSLNSRAGSYK